MGYILRDYENYFHVYVLEWMRMVHLYQVILYSQLSNCDFRSIKFECFDWDSDGG